MVVSTESLWEELPDGLGRAYDDVTIYGDAERETVLHEGQARVLINGWVELPSGRLLSPNAIHHIDVIDG